MRYKAAFLPLYASLFAIVKMYAEDGLLLEGGKVAFDLFAEDFLYLVQRAVFQPPAVLFPFSVAKLFQIGAYGARRQGQAKQVSYTFVFFYFSVTKIVLFA